MDQFLGSRPKGLDPTQMIWEFRTLAVAEGGAWDGLVLAGIAWSFTLDSNGKVVLRIGPDRTAFDLTRKTFRYKQWKDAIDEWKATKGKKLLPNSNKLVDLPPG
jgi:hypothetical protein